jgi:hypothetical protein
LEFGDWNLEDGIWRLEIGILFCVFCYKASE